MLKGLEGLDEMGVYEIVCLKSHKRYIGGTTQTLRKRLQHHISMLRADKHKNKHLQNSYNKHGEINFKVNILEVVKEKENVLSVEQMYLDNSDNLFNINPLASGTPNMSIETIKKRAETMKRRYKSGEIVSSFKGRTPWNKGLTKDKHDYSYLKVPKTITPNLIERHKLMSLEKRNELPMIEVYDTTGKFLRMFNSAKDLEEWSGTEDNDLPIKSRFSTSRMNVPINMLQAVSINKSCRTGKPYKNLIFKYAELKLDELLETPEEDNQQPS